MTLKIKDPSPIVTEFKMEIRDNKIVEPISITNYLKELYQSDSPINLPILEGPKEVSKLITEEEVKDALIRLKKSATGMD